jgi:uncharacterized glyoxalase superfamily protein PhnB
MAERAKFIPEGYGTVTPTIVVKNGAEAIDFYTKAFGAEEVNRFEGPGGGVLHAEVTIGGSRVMLGEENAQTHCVAPSSLAGSPSSLYLYVENADAAFERALQAGAKSEMAVEDMFWGDRMGAVSDPSGHRWCLATHKQDLTPEQIKRGAEQFFKTHKN